jgi:hypothetical protein
MQPVTALMNIIVPPAERTTEGPEGDESEEHPESNISDKDFPDPTETCRCIGRSSQHCPLNIHTSSGPFRGKKVITRGTTLLCTGC